MIQSFPNHAYSTNLSISDLHTAPFESLFCLSFISLQMDFIYSKFSQLRQKGRDLKNDIKHSLLTTTPHLKHLTPSVLFCPSHLSLQHCHQLSHKLYHTQFHILNLTQPNGDFCDDKVRNVQLFNLPVLSLVRLLELTAQIRRLTEEQKTVVVRGKEGSILLSMYLYLEGQYQFLDEALIYVNSLMGIKKDETDFPSQHTYFRNCMNLVSGIQLHPTSLTLTKITLKEGVRLIKPNPEGVIERFRPYIQISRDNHKTSYSEYKEEKKDLVVVVNEEVKDDIIVVVKHESNPHLHFTCFRMAINTNFVYNMETSIGKNEMDISGTVELPQEFTIRLEFGEGKGKSRLEEVWKQTQNAFGRLIQPKQIPQPQPTPSLIEPQSPQPVQPSPSQPSSPEPEIIHPLLSNLIEVKDQDEPQDIDDYINNLEKSISQN